MNYVVLVLRIVLGAIFIVAGSSKIGHPSLFAAEIAGFRILPQVVIAPLALVLPYLEVLLGAYLILGLFTTWSEVARDAAFVVLALVVALRAPGRLALDHRIGKGP